MICPRRARRYCPTCRRLLETGQRYCGPECVGQPKGSGLVKPLHPLAALLTPVQKEVFDYIVDVTTARGVLPPLRELAMLWPELDTPGIVGIFRRRGMVVGS